MLEQAIVDAAALREAALKNAEQSIIEKYAPQIKEAVNSLLGKEVLEEQSIGATATSELPPTAIEAPFAASPMDNPNKEVELTLTDEEQTWEFDLNKIKQEMATEGGMEEPTETTEDLMGDLGLGEEGTEEPMEEPGDLALQEVMKILNELDDEEILEEELIIDMAGQDKGGWIETNGQELKYRQEMELAKQESDEFKEENEELEKKVKSLSESLSIQIKRNKKILQIIEKLDKSLNETLLSNAKLLYSNHTLSDASLNERQKNKIVEAIAQAKTLEEAKNLQEALKTTVGTSKKDGPQSLSESVSRRSSLTGIMPRRKKPEQEFSFASQMKKLAGIK
tara:strand:+ start:343 stop:1356 length:1014 start_codon:yes stop_codon:yes gene_type:complete